MRMLCELLPSFLLRQILQCFLLTHFLIVSLELITSLGNLFSRLSAVELVKDNRVLAVLLQATIALILTFWFPLNFCWPFLPAVRFLSWQTDTYFLAFPGAFSVLGGSFGFALLTLDTLSSNILFRGIQVSFFLKWSATSTHTKWGSCLFNLVSWATIHWNSNDLNILK